MGSLVSGPKYSRGRTTQQRAVMHLTETREFTTQPAHYTLNIRKGILEVNPPGAGEEQLVINTDTLS